MYEYRTQNYDPEIHEKYPIRATSFIFIYRVFLKKNLKTEIRTFDVFTKRHF